MVSKSNQLEVAPLKNLFSLAVLKLYVKDSLGYNKIIERMEKHSLQYKLIIYKDRLACILLYLACTLE